MDWSGEKKGFCCTRIRGWFLSGDRFISAPKDDRAPFSCRFLPPITIVYFRPKTNTALYRGRYKRKEQVLILEQENPDDPPSKCSPFFSDLPFFPTTRFNRERSLTVSQTCTPVDSPNKLFAEQKTQEMRVARNLLPTARVNIEDDS